MPLENTGAQMVREVASKTSDVAGDGTTTATVLAQAIFREGVKTVAAGANPMALKRGIERAVELIVSNTKISRSPPPPTNKKTKYQKKLPIACVGDPDCSRPGIPSQRDD